MIGILYVLFFFMTSKQMYASSHFTGSSTIITIILKLSAYICLILEIAFLFVYAKNTFILYSVLLFVIAIIVTMILNGFISKMVIWGMRKEGIEFGGDEHSPQRRMSFALFQSRCDITTTVIAQFGFITNLIIAFVVIFCYL